MCVNAVPMNSGEAIDYTFNIPYRRGDTTLRVSYNMANSTKLTILRAYLGTLTLFTPVYTH